MSKKGKYALGKFCKSFLAKVCELDCKIMEKSIFEELCELTAKNKLVPFLGAGCSMSHLNCDWDSLMEHLNFSKANNITNPEIAQIFVDKYGKEKLAEELKKHLLITDFDPTKGYIHTSVMASMSNIIYTTNQDNVMEKCVGYYGRKIYPVVSLEDLINALPNGMLYIKFHGDLMKPESIVFTSDDYAYRIKNETFLEIRLKADLLGKKFLFLGYSLRDDNIKALLTYMNRKFPEELPDSYLISYSDNSELAEACEKYSIKLIRPWEMFPELSTSEAFEKYLYEWNKKTFLLKTNEQLNAFFHPVIPYTVQVVAPIEIKILEDLIEKLPLNEAINKFRYIFDQARIPKPLEQDVLEMFGFLCKHCDTTNVHNLEGASFNLLITDANLKFDQAVYSLLLGNFANISSFGIYLPTMHGGFPQGLAVILGAFAIDVIRKNNIKLNKQFLLILSHLCDNSMGYKVFGNDAIKLMEETYTWLWTQQKTSLENPLRRQERLGIDKRKDADLSSFRDTYDSLMRKLPVRGF